MDNEEEYRIIAKDYFEKYYVDRGMVKWNGYYLSDHTESAGKHSADEAHKRSQVAMPEMAVEEVTEIIFKAYAQNAEISVQANSKSKMGFNSPIISGKVKGFDDTHIYIGEHKFELDDILWCELRR
ncbi:hypothetical protein ESZ50_02255 [Weissella muntiaci]|uniref:DNA-directed RNA polymerase beta subunit n=1 Tax=Weissella muntiaci TaxID=2508881 RepID=A0A6C2C900_9LACO|nr:hypothetical protein [Weissella muntiaci]TYC50510.1 hypothetical protein ESZ50_02255 [Weissella muntiaci]